MKIDFKYIILLFLLNSLVISKKETTIKITTTREEQTDAEESNPPPQKEKKETDAPEEEHPVKSNDDGRSETEKMIEEAKKNSKQTSFSKSLTLVLPYQDNEDFILSPLGLGTPVNFAPVQAETTSYKSWVLSVSNEANPSIFAYNIKESKTGVEDGDWDSVVDSDGTISGNVIYDTAHIGKYKIEKFKFIEAVEFDDDFKDFKIGKLGLGNCQYASKYDKEFCLIQRLKDNGSIERRIFSIKELSDTHGELVIGDISKNSKENDYPLLNVINEAGYDDMEDEPFKMGWLTKISYVIFRNSAENIKEIFKNNIYLEEGIASFDSSSHYIEAPYSYISNFQDQLFSKYYANACRKVNNNGDYMFLCERKRFEKLKDQNKNLSLVLVMDGYGFEIPMTLLFERTSKEDYEFFVHFKDFEQNVWNLGHPFFHQYTLIFDQDNQEVGIDGGKVYSLQDETEEELKKVKSGSRWKYFFYAILLFGLIALLFWIARRFGILSRINKGVDRSLVDEESKDDMSFAPGQNIH